MSPSFRYVCSNSEDYFAQVCCTDFLKKNRKSIDASGPTESVSTLGVRLNRTTTTFILLKKKTQTHNHGVLVGFLIEWCDLIKKYIMLTGFLIIYIV